MSLYKMERFTKGERALIEKIFEDDSWLDELDDSQAQFVKEEL